MVGLGVKGPEGIAEIAALPYLLQYIHKLLLIILRARPARIPRLEEGARFVLKVTADVGYPSVERRKELDGTETWLISRLSCGRMREKQKVKLVFFKFYLTAQVEANPWHRCKFKTFYQGTEL